MLEGTLESFTLPDVFQLLALTRKTGCLRLRHEDDEGQVFFEEGQVHYAVSSSGRLALGRRLVGAGLLSAEVLRQALDQQREAQEVHGESPRIGQILIELGAIDEDTLETFVREQIQDAVFDLLRWQHGAFSFEQNGPDSRRDEPIRLAVSVENLIMEGSRRLEEWEQVRRKIPSLDAVVAMVPVAGSDGVDVSLKPDEWRLLTMVDGRRTVREFVDLFGQGEFHTCKILHGMVGAGLLEVRDAGPEGAPGPDLLDQQELLLELETDATFEGAQAESDEGPGVFTMVPDADDADDAAAEGIYEGTYEHTDGDTHEGGAHVEDEHQGWSSESGDHDAGAEAEVSGDAWYVDHGDQGHDAGGDAEHDQGHHGHDAGEAEGDHGAWAHVEVHDYADAEDDAGEDHADHDHDDEGHEGSPGATNGHPTALDEEDDDPEDPDRSSRLTTDPSLSEDLVRRLIDGVKGL